MYLGFWVFTGIIFNSECKICWIFEMLPVIFEKFLELCIFTFSKKSNLTNDDCAALQIQKKHWIVHFKIVNFMLYKFYLT